MDKIIIEGQNSLSGSVAISGAKNAVLPIMAAALMGKGRATITRVPDLRDTRTMIRLMEIIGAVCEYENGTLTVDGSIVDNPEAP
ncbi:MAG: UDP-N-acetylglucosamine 1-carboxyvinyltransferase, partial [Candidatus Neomarinimicrobiota bacterium]|nr:UDP-N-acetylglucosamine 1-carboxyvinyltransferase [Candidatus Neomarinimicrobiota bacterium]